MDIKGLLNTLRRRWRIFLAGVLVGVGVGALATVTATPQYESSARLFVTTSPSDTQDAYQGGLFSVQRVSSYADLVLHSQELANDVISQLGLDLTSSELLSKVHATVDTNTVILNIAVSDANASLSSKIAQSYAQNLTDLVRTLETPPGQTVPPIKTTIVDSASTPTNPISPRPLRNLLFGMLGGLVLGYLLALAREYWDTTIKGPEDLSRVVGAPILGLVAFDPSARLRALVTQIDTHSSRAESFRVLRTNLSFVDVGNLKRVFVITSGLPEEGKTSTAVNLAITLAQAGVNTLLIEGDLRRPRAHSALGLDAAVGVTSVLLRQVELSDAVQTHSDSGLSVLASGPTPPNPADLLQSSAMRLLIEGAKAEFDVVLIDAPPLLPVTDAALLAAQADGALIVARFGKTTKEQLARAVAQLSQVDARVIGTVLNMIPSGSLKGSSGYGYGYGYAPDQSGDRKRRVSWPIRSR